MLIRYLREDPSLALSLDLYELSMAQGFWKSGRLNTEAVFHLYYRANPFGGGYGVWAGLADALDALEDFRFSPGDLEYLAGLRNRKGGPLFQAAFLDHLKDFRFTCSVDAVAEGSVVFPQEPLLAVRGPIMEAQLAETILLTVLNFQTLIATKAARIVLSARGEPVVDFGLRRAQGVDGGFSASRAAFIGGCAGTSNVLAGRHLGIPVLGTFAHSWVMAFDSEPEAFDAFAESMPDNAVFLVDTYGTLNGVKNAIRAGARLKERGHEMAGIRLDSGDLAYLSIEARRRLDAAGMEQALIMGSSDLDEWLIRSLKEQGARINAWGVGTRLITGHGDPALGGVYKLVAVRAPGESRWSPRLKLSESKAKMTIPGPVQVYRCSDAQGVFLADAIALEEEPPEEMERIVDPNDNTKTRALNGVATREPLLQPAMRQGRRLAPSPALPELRTRVLDQLSRLHAGHKRLENPHLYPVGLTSRLNELRDGRIAAARAELERAERETP